MTSCLECQLDMHAPRAAVPLCTLASIPRQPEHCIEWAHLIAWESQKPFPKLDNDDPAHITWLFRTALSRAQEFDIKGVTYALTQGVVKNIIPAIASTNAIVAASCALEALKLATGAAPALGMEDNYMMYSGDDGIYTYTFSHQKKPDCPVCGNLPRPLTVSPEWTVQELIDAMAVLPEAQLKKVSLRAEGKTIYMQSPPGLEAQTRPNLARGVGEFVAEGDEIAVTDGAFGSVTFRFRIVFEK